MGQCVVADCLKPVRHVGRQLCGMHLTRIERHGDAQVTLRPRQLDICSVPGCDRRPHGRGLCCLHRQRLRNTGSLDLAVVLPWSEQTNCEQCGQTFTRWSNTKRQRYCSKPCRDIAAVLARPACENCGRPVSSMARRFCSRVCSGIALRVFTELRTCLACGSSFRVRGDRTSTNRFCSRACSFGLPIAALGIAKWRCLRCQSEFVPASGKKFCSQLCRDEYNWDLTGRARNRDHVNRYKARKLGTQTERI